MVANEHPLGDEPLTIQLQIEPKFRNISNPLFLLAVTNQEHPSSLNVPSRDDTIWARQLPMDNRGVDLGFHHFYFIFFGIELNDKAMRSIHVGGDRRKVGPATRPIMVPMPTEGDRYRATRRPFIGSWFEQNAVFAAMGEGTLSHLEKP